MSALPFSFQPSIVNDDILDLKNLSFVDSAENIILVGTPGVGKTHIVTSIDIEIKQK